MTDKRKQIVLNELITLIDSIKEHTESLIQTNHIPSIELEYIISKITRLYEKSVILNFLNSLEDTTPTTSEQILPLITPTLSDYTVTPNEPALSDIKTTDETNSDSEIEKTNQTEEAKLSEATITSEAVNAPPSNVKEPESNINKTLTNTINEINKPSEDNGIPLLIKLNKISDPKRPAIHNLKNAISINLRLQFINNLFKGNVELMNQTLDELNSLNDITDAERKINTLIHQLNWNPEYELFINFKELIERRYS